MKRILLLFTIFTSYVAIAQDIEENFDDYLAGDMAAAVSPAIETWSGGTADDVTIVDSVFYSAPNSMSLFTESENGGPGDVIVPLDYSEMAYMVSFYIYVAEGTGAYFNIQTDVTPGIGWAYDLFFDASGGIDYQIAQVSQGTGTYTNGAWVLVENDIDLLNDIVKVSIDGEEQIQLPFTSDLGSINFYPFSTEPTALYYIDDILVEMYEPVNMSIQEPELDVTIFPNPASDAINVSGVSAGSQLVVRDLLGKEVHSSLVSELNNTIRTEEWERGYYFLTVSNEYGEVTKKVILE